MKPGSEGKVSFFPLSVSNDVSEEITFSLFVDKHGLFIRIELNANTKVRVTGKNQKILTQK